MGFQVGISIASKECVCVCVTRSVHIVFNQSYPPLQALRKRNIKKGKYVFFLLLLQQHIMV